MKSNITALTLLISFAAGSAQAEPVMVKTNYWQAPIEYNQILKIEPVDQSLVEVCKEYTDLVVGSDGETRLDQEFVQMLRTQSDGVFATEFSTLFRVRLAQSEALIRESIARANRATEMQSKRAPLPYYTPQTADIIPEVTNTDEVQVLSSRGSLTEISENLKLEPMPISIIGGDLNAKIKVRGKDTACDLLSGKITLNYTSMATIKISLDDQLTIDSFYTNLEIMTNDVLRKKKSPLARAAYLGFKLGVSLIEIEKNLDRAAIWALNIVDSFFDSNMNRNSRWSHFNGTDHLSVDGSTRAPIQLQLEK
ncbi:MAG: hypothetical protein KDD38_04475 [Bdellovibrionales bacterium]|nr:hypothetical protein [Bdellovibrionales bacterium]